MQLALPITAALPDPQDDDGALAQARFHFQAEVGARFCLAAIEDGSLLSIGCEHLEDLVLQGTASLTLVSVKHREPSREPWSIWELCGEGGLAHLFDRWIAATDVVPETTAVHVTNGGLKTGVGQAARLSVACGPVADQGDDALAFAKELAYSFLRLRDQKPYSFERIPETPPPKRGSDLPADDETVLMCRRFMRNLTFVGVPHRDDIGASNIIDHVMPHFEGHGLDGHGAKSGYESLVNHIEKKSRSFGGRRIDLIGAWMRTGVGVDELERRKRIAARTVSIQEAADILRHGTAAPLFPVGMQPVDAPGGSDLRRKLRDGGLGNTEMRFAERLRSAWHTTWRAHRLDLPGDASIRADVELRVLGQVLDAQRNARDEGGNYGRALFNELRRVVRVKGFTSRPQLRLDDAHALGVAFDLCDQCDFDFQSEPETAPQDGATR